MGAAAEFSRVARACEEDALREATVARNLTTEHSARRADEARINAWASFGNSRAMWVHALVGLLDKAA